ncbi:MAG: type II toxin-antitoxin system RelE/ParE family toxin [Desulfamplus sp.]|nr:type II toxin-antitoxin system RelE/ParE family toxin [Desulfamplus sp.]
MIKKLKDGDFDGDKISGVGHAVYKVRVASIDQKKGKSGGFRIIYYVVTSDNIIYLLVIYAKAKQENISAKKIKALLDTIP